MTMSTFSSAKGQTRKSGLTRARSGLAPEADIYAPIGPFSFGPKAKTVLTSKAYALSPKKQTCATARQDFSLEHEAPRRSTLRLATFDSQRQVRRSCGP